MPKAPHAIRGPVVSISQRARDPLVRSAENLDIAGQCIQERTTDDNFSTSADAGAERGAEDVVSLRIRHFRENYQPHPLTAISCKETSALTTPTRIMGIHSWLVQADRERRFPGFQEGYQAAASFRSFSAFATAAAPFTWPRLKSMR